MREFMTKKNLVEFDNLMIRSEKLNEKQQDFKMRKEDFKKSLEGENEF